MKIDIQNPRVNSHLVLWSFILLMCVGMPGTLFLWHKWHSLWAFAPLAIAGMVWVLWSNKLDRIRMKRYEEMKRDDEMKASRRGTS
jgi:hypothetical protein